ncbi:hypothetical protein NEOC95_000586 [Neochlamydia sp. AcF95]|nr:hypothetical protein [Neochlamydia sp. AcF95]
MKGLKKELSEGKKAAVRGLENCVINTVCIGGSTP